MIYIYGLYIKLFSLRKTRGNRTSIKWFNEDLHKKRKMLSKVKIISYYTSDSAYINQYKSLIFLGKKHACHNLIEHFDNKPKTVNKF